MMNIQEITYQVKSPILFIIFNRPDLTEKVFREITKVVPSRLYIAGDGPRDHKMEDAQLCYKCREIVGKINWSCTVYTKFNIDNRGCKIAVSEAIDWFFASETEGIILEDDCLPTVSFFYYCDTLLSRYRNDTRISCITGTNLQNGIKRGTASYYFSKYNNVWGWASWRRVWLAYDVDLNNYTENDIIEQFPNIFPDPEFVTTWLRIFHDLKLNKINTWDYQFNIITFMENAVCAVPNENLISNIGFRYDATHTTDPLSTYAALPTREISIISHPNCFLPDREADLYFFRNEFDL